MYEEKYSYFYKKQPFFFPYVYSIWQVVRDEEGPVFIQKLRGYYEPPNLYAIFRTFHGEGIMKTKKKTYRLTKNSLFLIKIDDIVTYFTESDTWKYVCYNFIPNAPIPFFKKEHIYNIPELIDERGTNDLLLNLKDLHDEYNANYATSLFCSLLFKWGYFYNDKTLSALPYYQEISESLNYINANLSEPFKVSTLAQVAHLSEKTFSRAFSRIVGLSPKRYITNQKMQQALLLLNTTNDSIQTISEALGYYSSFQFSRDFKNHFGVSPSKSRLNISNDSNS